jgi:cytochrome c
MNSFEFNKMAGALLGTALLVFGLQSLAGMIYHAPKPEKPGFDIKVAETGGETAGGTDAAAGGTDAAAGGDAAATESLGALLAKADAAKGQAVAKACQACHDLTKGGPNKVGPNLYDIVMRPRATHEGFTYSEAMLAGKDAPWSYENINAFITKPADYAKGTKMAYAGLKKAEDRADLLAYLATLSEQPKPFPAP